MPDTPPAERGSPAAQQSQGGSVLTRKMGPLPVWGWAAVGVAAVFLWRMQQSKNAANQAAQQASQTSSLPYVPGGGVGGVFLMPGSSGAPATPAPGKTTTNASTSYYPWWNAAAMQNFINEIDKKVGTGASFELQNNALKQAGQPYWHEVNGKQVFANAAGNVAPSGSMVNVGYQSGSTGIPTGTYAPTG